MRSHRAYWLAVSAIAFACASCSSLALREGGNPAPELQSANLSNSPSAQQRAATGAASNKGWPELARGIKSYEDGAYKGAAKQFQAALDLGLEAKADQATAHKYLAFMTCVSGREKSCRDEFRKALDADPAFELGPAEAGHPIWGSVLRSVKSDAATKAKAK